MKFHILFQEKEGASGGGNQFLKALKSQLIKIDSYAQRPDEANVILFNSYPFGAESLFFQLFKLKQRFPDKIILYRVDGPISVYRETDKDIDRAIAFANRTFSDGTIFQSAWSQEKNVSLFGLTAPFTTVIYNAPDARFFFPSENNSHRTGKTRLVGSSWSKNKNKGFSLFSWLDENLDFNRYEMTFIGNSPVSWKNLKTIPPLSSKELAAELKRHDIYIFASRIESCSNALIEALTLGLPAIAPNSSSNPEVVGKGGELYENTEDVLQKIDLVAENIEHYQSSIPKFNIEDVAQKYLAFAEKISRKEARKRSSVYMWLNFLLLQGIILKWKVTNFLKHILQK